MSRHDRSHLVPTAITNALGHQTTVYRRPDGAAAQKGLAPMPPPAVGAPPVVDDVDQAYADSLDGIRFANECWLAGDRSGAEGTESEAAFAMAGIMYKLIDAKNREDAVSLVDTIRQCLDDSEEAAIIVAEGIAPAVLALRGNDEVPDDDTLAIALERQDVGPADYLDVITVIVALQRADLREYSDTGASVGQDRLIAHLWAQANRVIDYVEIDRGGGDEVMADYARLVDEMPYRVVEMAPHMRRGVHAAGVRALIDGDTVQPLASGAL